jgi:hypothetical protein
MSDLKQRIFDVARELQLMNFPGYDMLWERQIKN